MNALTTLVLTYNPEDHRASDEPQLAWMLTEYRLFGHTIVGWATMTKQGVVPGVRAMLLQQGPYERGIFADGEVVGEPVRAGGNNPSSEHSADGKIWLVVPVMFTRLVDPCRDPLLHDARTCESMGIDLSQRASGMLVEFGPR